jgi:hypothetical protein
LFDSPTKAPTNHPHLKASEGIDTMEVKGHVASIAINAIAEMDGSVANGDVEVCHEQSQVLVRANPIPLVR